MGGQDWEFEIQKAVRESDVVVVCLSQQFNQRGFRQKEVRLALDTAMEQPEGEIFIIPARLEECETLTSLRKWHWVDLFESNGYEMLLRALRVRASKIEDINIPVNQESENKTIFSEPVITEFNEVFTDSTQPIPHFLLPEVTESDTANKTSQEKIKQKIVKKSKPKRIKLIVRQLK